MRHCTFDIAFLIKTEEIDFLNERRLDGCRSFYDVKLFNRLFVAVTFSVKMKVVESYSANGAEAE
jgi:hypothetical protein